MTAAGLILDALLAAAAILLAAPRPRALATLGAGILTPAMLLAGDSDRLPAFSARLAVAALVALAVLAAGAVVVTRRPALLPLAAVIAMPFRVPLGLGSGDSAYLLVPLYGVIAAGVLAGLAQGLRGRGEHRPPQALDWWLAGFLVLYAVQASYSTDITKALEQIVFFYVPFALLYTRVRGAEWRSRPLLYALVALGLVFCAVGFYQWATHHVWINDKLIQGNVYTHYFRVNSLFFDPNVYGRFLVVALLALTAAALWTRPTGTALALLAVLWVGLLSTRSESSMLALVLGVAVLAVLRDGSRRLLGRGPLIGLAAALVVVAVAAFAGGASLRKATSGRSDLVSGGVSLFSERPAWGWGSGAFAREFRRHKEHGLVSASHTIPITVAAEQGVIGLAVYLGLLLVAFRTLMRDAARSAARAAIAAIFAALVLHTLLYAAFLEDPLTWILFAAYTSSRATSLSPTSWSRS